VIVMGRTETKPGQAAKRPMAETSGASLPRNASVLSALDEGARSEVGDNANEHEFFF